MVGMTYSSVVLGQNPKHFWRLQGTTGTVADSGSAPVALTAGTADRGQSGAAYAGSTCHFFDTTGDAHTGTIAAISSAAYTISGLVKLHTTPPTTFSATMLGLSVDATQRMIFVPRRLDANSRVAYWDNTNTGWVEAGSALSTGVWHHVAVVVNGTNVKTYIDGVQSASGTITLPADSYVNVAIGMGTAVANPMKGWMQDIALFDSALSGAQITAQYDAFAGTGNVSPVANAGTDQTNVEVGDTVTLDGTGSDSDGTVSSLVWSQVGGSPTVTLSNSGNDPCTFEAPATLAGTTLTFRLTATDNLGATHTDDMTVQVLPATERVVVGSVEVPLLIRGV